MFSWWSLIRSRDRHLKDLGIIPYVNPLSLEFKLAKKLPHQAFVSRSPFFNIDFKMVGSSDHPIGMLQRVPLTILAASASETITFPVDFLKTRRQIYKGKSIALDIQTIWATRGLRGFFAGLTPAIARHVPYTGSRIFIYEQLRSSSLAAPYLAPGTDVPTYKTLLTRMLLGCTAGAMGQLVAVPADLIKVRLQANPTSYRSLLHAFSSIVREEGGVQALWRGSLPSIQRAAAVNLGELATYDAVKQQLLGTGHLQEGLALHVASSISSGLVASAVSTPFDLAKSRIMSQRGGPQKLGAAGHHQYRGVWDCMTTTARNEGITCVWELEQISCYMCLLGAISGLYFLFSSFSCQARMVLFRHLYLP